MKYRFIRDHVGQFSVWRMCRVFGVSRSGYYSWQSRRPSARRQDNHRLLQEIRQIHGAAKGRVGSPAVFHELLARRVRCSRKRVERLMRDNGLRSCHGRRFRPATTQSNHRFPVAANLLNQQFTETRPDKVWLTDITYIRTREGWLYLAAVLDLGTRMIVGWSAGKDLSRQLTIRALTTAIRRRHPPSGLLHHSDRGVQYACHDYQALLNRHGFVPSMSRKGNCYDNAVMESFFHTLKVELVHRENYRTQLQATNDLFEYVEIYYNRKRRHSSLNYMTPSEYDEHASAA